MICDCIKDLRLGPNLSMCLKKGASIFFWKRWITNRGCAPLSGAPAAPQQVPPDSVALQALDLVVGKAKGVAVRWPAFTGHPVPTSLVRVVGRLDSVKHIGLHGPSARFYQFGAREQTKRASIFGDSVAIRVVSRYP